MQGIGLSLSPHHHNSVRNEREKRAEMKVAQLNGGATNRVVNLGGCDDTRMCGGHKAAQRCTSLTVHKYYKSIVIHTCYIKLYYSAENLKTKFIFYNNRFVLKPLIKNFSRAYLVLNYYKCMKNGLYSSLCYICLSKVVGE